MDIADQLIRIFCDIDEFCKEFDSYTPHKLLSGPTKSSRGPNCQLALSEIMTILVIFHFIRFRDFKTFYKGHLETYWRSYFPKLPSYNRFIELIPRAIFPLTLFTHIRGGKQTGIYYIDSSCLPVCHLKRHRRHKTFENIASFGRTSVGWFFGLKLHLVTNEQGELMAFKITSGASSDSKSAESLLNALHGLAFGDKGYIGKKLFETLFKKGLKLITRKRKNMQPMILNDYEKQLLNQRNTIETVINHLKFHYQVWHTRHRSVLNAMTHLISSLAAYAIEPLKLSAIKLLA
jgi:hypothetical protein